MSLLIILFSVTCNCPLRTPLSISLSSKACSMSVLHIPPGPEVGELLSMLPIAVFKSFLHSPFSKLSFWSFEYSFIFEDFCSPLTLTRLIYVHFIICKLCLNRANLKIQKGRKISVLGFQGLSNYWSRWQHQGTQGGQQEAVPGEVQYWCSIQVKSGREIQVRRNNQISSQRGRDLMSIANFSTHTHTHTRKKIMEKYMYPGQI